MRSYKTNGKIWELPARSPEFERSLKWIEEDLATHMLTVQFESAAECDQHSFVEVGIYEKGIPRCKAYEGTIESSFFSCPICKGGTVISASSVSCGVCLECGEVVARNSHDLWKAVNMFYACKNYGMLDGFVTVVEHFEIKGNSYFVV